MRTWAPFRQGETIGTTGPEGGVIVCDEVAGDSARITLEDGGATAWVTCTVSGFLYHSRQFATTPEGIAAVNEMKPALLRLFDEATEEVRLGGTGGRASEQFVQRFPYSLPAK